MKHQLDNNLALRLHNNDMEAFNALYWKHHTAVYANALKLTHDAFMAQDIVQEVFITVWEKRHTIDTTKDIAAWIFVISHNKCINQLKKQLKASIETTRLADMELQEHAEENATNIYQEQLNILDDALRQLSPQKRKVFQLCKMEGKTYEKAANELHISKHTVKEYLHEAVVNIKKYVQQHPVHPVLLIFCATAVQLFTS